METATPYNRVCIGFYMLYEAWGFLNKQPRFLDLGALGSLFESVHNQYHGIC